MQNKVNVVNVKKPTSTTYCNQINRMCETIETQCNKLLDQIASNHSYPSKVTMSLEVHHTSLPTMYSLLKTHKIPPGVDPGSLSITQFKTRPIVSCSGSPTEKLAWLISRIISPLLKHIPPHLFNIHSHLETLRSLSSTDLPGLKIYSADIAALYTNLSIEHCISDIINMAEEYWDDLETWGLSLTELHQLLEVVFYNSYFTFNQKLYKQCVGLFMGCSPSPVAAVIRVYTFEKNSVYIDSFYITSPVKLLYVRYMDDNCSLAPGLEYAEEITTMIADQDPDKRIKWEIDCQTNDRFVPFLDTELRITPDGELQSRYYRKPQNRGIILNAKSHHPDRTKTEAVKNLYKTAIDVSSGPEELQHSLNIVDKLAAENGYSDSRQMGQPTSAPGTKKKKKKKKKKNTEYLAPLVLPYISEVVCNKIRNYIKQQKLKIRPIFKPGRTLSQMYCKSRPLDTRICVLGNPSNCDVCPMISNGNCSMSCLVYRITCKLCSTVMEYNGETYRPCHDRFLEHRRAANNPEGENLKNGVGKHYNQFHKGCKASLEFYILDRQSVTVRRKISEAFQIYKNEPAMNDRMEMADTRKLLV